MDIIHDAVTSRRRRWGRSAALVVVASALGVGATAVGFTFAAQQRSGAPRADVAVSTRRHTPRRGRKAQFAANSGKLGENTTITVASHGTNGDCAIPSTATALSLVVTSFGTDTAGNYLTVFPAGTTLPTTSNLNPDPKTNVTVDAVTIQLSTTGAFSVSNFTGTTHLLVDVLGYDVSGSASGAAGPDGPAGPAGCAAPTQQLYYPDRNGDSEGNAFISVGDLRLATTAPAGYVTNTRDCNDFNPAIDTAAVEVDDSTDQGFYIDTGQDENCDNSVLATLAIDGSSRIVTQSAHDPTRLWGRDESGGDDVGLDVGAGQVGRGCVHHRRRCVP